MKHLPISPALLLLSACVLGLSGGGGARFAGHPVLAAALWAATVGLALIPDHRCADSQSAPARMVREIHDPAISVTKMSPLSSGVTPFG